MATPDRPRFVFLNGRHVGAARAAVSVFDRGLLYGDGIFETMRAYRGIVFAAEKHLQRLHSSARALGLPLPPYDWPRVFRDTLRQNRLLRRDAWLRLTVTRGPAPPGLLPPSAPQPTAILLAGRVDRRLRDRQEDGVGVIVLDFSRGPLPAHKSLNYLPSMIGNMRAAECDADSGLFTDESGALLEGTTASLFCVIGGRLVTPPLDCILPGVTRQIVIDLAAAADTRVVERTLRPTDLRAADEAFLTSSVAEIVPVVRVGDHPIAAGRPGPVTRLLQHAYRQEVERCRAAASPSRKRRR